MTENVKVIFYPSRVEGIVPKGITILEAARMLGIGLEGPCNGAGKCSKDLVQVRTNKTLDVLLACKTIVAADLEVIVPSHENRALKTVEHFHSESAASGRIDTIIKKEAVLDGETRYTKVYVAGKPVFVEVGDTISISYGIALDIGTTTIVAALIDLNSGETVESSSTLNPLVFYGHDVMSRIRYSVSQKDGLLKMHRELISAVNLLINVLTTDTGVKPENIYQLAAAGNTTMQHIFLNKEIAGIGEYPYRAEVLDTFTTTAKELAVRIADFATVTTFPCISAYVGGDIVSGLLAIDLKESETPALFIDIGTNGEMALLLDGRIVATSTAAGPCFEGMTISSGMRAGPGAIEHVSFGEELSLEIIGGGPARGICGSGLLDLVSELIRTGLVNSRGRLQGRESSEVSERYKGHLFEKNGKRHFKLTDGVSISQEDIRQVQLAKAAIRAGVEILLDECNLKVEELKKIIVAGAFGYHIKESSLFGVGLLPELNGTSLSFVGNSSLGGAVRMLLNKGVIDDSSHIARTAENYDLSKVPGFEAAYIREMHF